MCNKNLILLIYSILLLVQHTLRSILATKICLIATIVRIVAFNRFLASVAIFGRQSVPGRIASPFKKNSLVFFICKRSFVACLRQHRGRVSPFTDGVLSRDGHLQKWTRSRCVYVHFVPYYQRYLLCKCKLTASVQIYNVNRVRGLDGSWTSGWIFFVCN